MLEIGNGLRIGGHLPLTPLFTERAASCLTDLTSAAADAGCVRLLDWLGTESFDVHRLGAALSLSPFLDGMAQRRPDWLETLFGIEAGERIEAIIRTLGQTLQDESTESIVMTQLREAKAEAALLIALRDLFGAASPEQTTADLSRLAAAAVERALRFCLADLNRRGSLRLPDPNDPERGAGLFVLGMGKLGGGELNYSSDIDLVLLFEPEAEAILDPSESVDLFSRLARRLVRMIGERTRDGYVFRTDLRLRPDPSAMPLAVAVKASNSRSI